MKEELHEEQSVTNALNEHLQELNEQFDPEFMAALAKSAMDIFDRVYFRPVFIGFDEPILRNNPNHPVILVSNHSGMAFPWDALVFGAGLFKKMGYNIGKSFRAMVAPMLSETQLMNPYLIKDLWYRIGGVDATFRNFETMMQLPESNLLIYPEGVPGIGKGWNRRYELQRFATSFVRMSLKYKTDIVPFYTINGENINPYSYSFPWLNNLVRKIGIPFLPIGIHILLLPLQPWLFYYALPAKLTYVIGQRLSPSKWIDKAFDEITEEEIYEIRDRIHKNMQDELNGFRAQYAKQPYKFGEHLRKIKENLNLFPYFLPWGWAFVFHEFMRLWKRRTPGKDIELKLGWGSFIRILILNPFTIFYFLPIIGWIPILIKGYRGGIRKKPK